MRILFVLLAISFYSCKKCAECETVTITDISPSTAGYPQTSKTSTEYCDEDLKDINGKTATSTYNSSGYTVTTTSKTTCK